MAKKTASPIDDIIKDMPHRKAMQHFRVNMPKMLDARLNEVKALVTDLEEKVYAAEGNITADLMQASKLYAVAIVNCYLPEAEAAKYKKENIEGVTTASDDTAQGDNNSPGANDNQDGNNDQTNDGDIDPPSTGTQNNNQQQQNNSGNNNQGSNNNTQQTNNATGNNEPAPAGLTTDQKAQKIVETINAKGNISIDELMELGVTVKEGIDFIRINNEVRLTRDPENETRFLLQHKQGNAWKTIGIGLAVITGTGLLIWGIYELVRAFSKK